MKPAIAYYRASTKRQGQSGLGIDAQQKSVEEFVRANGYELLGDYIEIKTGKRNERYGLNAALSECKRNGATLLIAKLDRLSRRVAFIATRMESNVDFKVVDLPDADEFTPHMLAAVLCDSPG